MASRQNIVRIIRAAVIGGGLGLAVGGAFYISQQQIAASKPMIVPLNPEWGFKTRQEVINASKRVDRAGKIDYIERALSSLAAPTTKLNTKSATWLSGYADLLRTLGLNMLEDGRSGEEVLPSLQAAASIPFGDSGLRAQAQAALYELTGDSKQLYYNSLESGMNPGTDRHLTVEEEIKQWSPLLLLRAANSVQENDLIGALNQYLRLHKMIDPANDTLCYKAQAGGFVGQILWRLGHTDEAQRWFRVSTEDAKCSTPACEQTRMLLSRLLCKGEQRSIE